jgi:hypothetical protein
LEASRRKLIRWKLNKHPQVQRPETLAGRELGIGGFGAVKKGTDVYIRLIWTGTFKGTCVAIKEVRNKANLSKLAAEARISCTLCIHPNVVNTFGLWIDEGSSLLVMGV